MRNKHRFWKGTGWLLILTTILGGCATIQRAAKNLTSGRASSEKITPGGTTLSSGLLPISDEEAKTIGAALALQIVARYGGLYDHPELTRYVNLVGRAVAFTSDRPLLNYHFAILHHEAINAFAAPGGYVFITTGLLQQIRNEAELAAVLGHEISHISEKHILQIMQHQKQIAGVAEAGLGYAHQRPEAFRQLIDLATTKLLDEGLDQTKELQADRLGVVFATRVGYEPTAYTDLLERLRDLKGDDQAFFASHPSFSARLGEVDAIIPQVRWTPASFLLTERFVSHMPGEM